MAQLLRTYLLEVELRHVEHKYEGCFAWTKNTTSGTRCWALCKLRNKHKDPAVLRRRALMQIRPFMFLRTGHFSLYDKEIPLEQSRRSNQRTLVLQFKR